MIRPLMLGSILCLLSACATPPVRVEAAKPVVVTVTKYAPLEAYLVAPCAKPVPRSEALASNGALLAAYLQDSTALTACGAKIDGIRALQPGH